MPSDRWNVQLLPHGAAAALSLSVRLAASRALPKKPYRTVPASDGPRVSLCGWRRFLRKVFLDPACAGRRDVKYPMPVLLAGESFFSVQGHHLLQKYQYCHVQEETAFSHERRWLALRRTADVLSVCLCCGLRCHARLFQRNHPAFDRLQDQLGWKAGADGPGSPGCLLGAGSAGGGSSGKSLKVPPQRQPPGA